MSGEATRRASSFPSCKNWPLAVQVAATSWRKPQLEPSETSSSTSPICSFTAPLSKTSSFPTCAPAGNQSSGFSLTIVLQI